MRYFILSFVVFTCVVGVSAGGAAAQEADTVAHYTLALRATTGTAPATIIRYQDPKRAALERKVRRSRGALIGTSVAAAVGLPLWVVARTRKCTRIDPPLDRYITCTKTGTVMRGTGLSLFWGGLAGMLISGTMVGVRKRQLDDLGYRAEYPKPRAIRWDPAGSQFVF